MVCLFYLLKEQAFSFIDLCHFFLHLFYSYFCSDFYDSFPPSKFGFYSSFFCSCFRCLVNFCHASSCAACFFVFSFHLITMFGVFFLQTARSQFILRVGVSPSVCSWTNRCESFFVRDSGSCLLVHWNRILSL